MKIYGDSKSGNCLKVKWTADFLKIPYDWIETDIMVGQSRTPEFLAMNPDGRVPTVVLDDGRPLAQSNAIIWHLAEGSTLIPPDAYARAKTLEWLFFEQYSHEPYIAVARFQVRYLGKTVSELEPRLVERGWAALGVLEQALAKSKFLQGEAPTLADIALVAYTRAGHEGGFHLANHPGVQAWIARVEQALGIEDPVGAPALA